jgi:hypothetical protein
VSLDLSGLGPSVLLSVLRDSAFKTYILNNTGKKSVCFYIAHPLPNNLGSDRFPEKLVPYQKSIPNTIILTRNVEKTSKSLASYQYR